MTDINPDDALDIAAAAQAYKSAYDETTRIGGLLRRPDPQGVEPIDFQKAVEAQDAARKALFQLLE